MGSITAETSIAIGLVVMLMGAASSFGVMWNKINNAEKKHDEDKEQNAKSLEKLEAKLDEQNKKIDRILEILAESGLKKSDQ